VPLFDIGFRRFCACCRSSKTDQINPKLLPNSRLIGYTLPPLGSLRAFFLWGG
jgi:hypothetical protein